MEYSSTESATARLGNLSKILVNLISLQVQCRATVKLIFIQAYCDLVHRLKLINKMQGWPVGMVKLSSVFLTTSDNKQAFAITLL